MILKKKGKLISSLICVTLIICILVGALYLCREASQKQSAEAMSNIPAKAVNVGDLLLSDSEKSANVMFNKNKLQELYKNLIGASSDNKNVTLDNVKTALATKSAYTSADFRTKTSSKEVVVMFGGYT